MWVEKSSSSHTGGIRMSTTPVICPVCRTRTGICLRDAHWYCCVCGVDYIDTDFEQVIE